MSKTHVQVSRSNVTGARPAAGSQPVGSLYVNFPDEQLGVINPDGTPIDLIPKNAADLGAAPADHTHDFPVDSVNGQTGDVVLTAADVGAASTDHTHDFPVDSVNGQTGDVVLTAPDVGAAPANHTHNYPVDSVNGKTGAVVLNAADVSAAALGHLHVSADITDFAEAVDDRAAALIKAGANVSVTYDDANNTLTIAASGGGGSAPTISTDVGNQTKLGSDQGVFTPLPTVAQIGAAPASHTHVATDIVDFAEAVDDRAAALIKAGTNVTVTYDDVANSLIIASTGGGGGSTRVIEANDAEPGLRVTQTGTGAALLIEDSASPDTTPFAVTTDGKVLVGNTTAQQFMRPGANLVVAPLQVNGSTGADAVASVAAWGNDDAAAALVLASSRGGAPGTHGKLLDKDNIGSIVFNASTGTGFVRAGLINVDIDGTPGAGSFPTRLVFGITDASSPAIKEALCINSAQAIGVFGTGAPNYGTAGQVLTSRGAAAGTRWEDPAPTRVIDANDANPGLRITQTGLGYPLLVEDINSPDPTPFAIDSVGTVLVASPQSYDTQRPLGTVNTPVLQLHGTVGSRMTQGIYDWSTGIEGGPALIFSKSGGGAVGTHAVPGAGSDLGSVNFNASNGTEFKRAAQIKAMLDGTATATSAVGRLDFTVFDGTTPNPNASMTISSSGSVGIGSTTPGAAKLRVVALNALTGNHALLVDSSAAAAMLRVRNDGQILTGTEPSSPYNLTTATAANLVVTSTGALQRSTSSIKYKKDVEDLDQALVDNAISKLRPVWYRTKEPNGDDKAEWSHIGLIAEEVAAVEPRLAIYRTMKTEEVKVPVVDDTGKQRMGADGEPQYDTETQEVVLETPEVESVDYARLSVILLDKVQRLTASLEAMTTKVEALEARLIAVESKPGAA